MENFYKTLGVEPGASQEEIKKKFRKLALKHHPDRAGSKADENKFKKINEAYSVIGDPQKRRDYDSRQSVPRGFEGFASRGNFEDVWSDFFGDFGDVFNSRPEPQRKEPEPRVRFEVSIADLESGDLVQEFSRTLNVECKSCEGRGGAKPRVCPTCSGTGQVVTVQQVGMMRMQSVAPCGKCSGLGKVFSSVCGDCRGVGKLQKLKRYRVKISTETLG